MRVIQGDLNYYVCRNMTSVLSNSIGISLEKTIFDVLIEDVDPELEHLISNSLIDIQRRKSK